MCSLQEERLRALAEKDKKEEEEAAKRKKATEEMAEKMRKDEEALKRKAVGEETESGPRVRARVCVWESGSSGGVCRGRGRMREGEREQVSAAGCGV